MAIWLWNYISIPIWNYFVKNKKIFVSIICLQMFLLAIFFEETLRVDYGTYSQYFDEVSTYSFGGLLGKVDLLGFPEVDVDVRCENGWMILNWLVAQLGFGFNGFLMVHSLFCICSLGFFLYKYSEKPWLSFALFIALGFYKYTFGILRQIMTMCLFMYAVPYIKERKLGKFLTIVCINFFIHRGSLIYAVLYFISRIKINRKIFAGYYLMAVLCLVASPFLIDGVIAPLMAMLDYAHYVPESWAMNNQVILVFTLPILLFFTINFDDFFENKINNITCWGFLLTLPIQVFSTLHGVFGRLAFYYYIFIIMLLPADLTNYKNKKVAMLGASAAYILCGLFYVYTMIGTEYVPYISIFG